MKFDSEIFEKWRTAVADGTIQFGLLAGVLSRPENRPNSLPPSNIKSPTLTPRPSSQAEVCMDLIDDFAGFADVGLVLQGSGTTYLRTAWEAADCEGYFSSLE